MKPVHRRVAPRDMRIAPALPSPRLGTRAQPRYALLINPFYPKDPSASFGKHVLTPTLALTSVAGATPSHWQVRYWDENLLQGPPPSDPLPEVVEDHTGINLGETVEGVYDYAGSVRTVNGLIDRGAYQN